ncbi:RICIN domain-containing protein [Streptomyces sp. NPDC055962]|uniref:RICIN domain-containing protein n=1 Tax=Streptomyces sp. NPDC055962 TaxID=3345667 RepID=UPI0035DCC29D
MTCRDRNTKPVRAGRPAALDAVDVGSWYELINQGSGKALDISGASTAEGGAVQQWTRNGGAHQRFQFVDSGDGYYRLKAQHSGKVLDVHGWSDADHADIVQWGDTSGSNQQFRLEGSADGRVRLINRNSGKAVEVRNAATTDGAKVVQSTDRGGVGQQWRLVPVSSVSEQVHTAGRVKDLGATLQFSWPGVYFEGRFRGTGLGVVLDCAAADYDVQVDGATIATLVTPGDTTHWINGLGDGEHTVRVVKRNETPGDTSTFGGFVAAPGGAVLSKPEPRARQIEFIGDSLTVGYGNVSGTRDCDPEQVKRNTNTDVSYSALAARQLGADYQINGLSGLGMVRNVAGICPELTYRTYYDRALLNVDGDVWQNPGTWRPQIVVVNLGANDFSDLTPGEPWTPGSLATAYRTAYGEFLRTLRTRYGADAALVAVGFDGDAEHVRQVVEACNDAGDSGVHYWHLDQAGLDFLGCEMHTSAQDDRLIADRLAPFLGSLPASW